LVTNRSVVEEQERKISVTETVEFHGEGSRKLA
jgi:hypothetical protein